MNTHEELELKKEFQLERIILFSDAVFAIILTIMVIELKLPESIRNASVDEFKHEFKNVIIHLLGYAISFFFVAMFWTRHVKLLGFLKDYNKNMLIFNLIFLFCISLFPFAVSLITGFSKIETIQAQWGFNVYIVVIFLSLMSFTALSGYLVKHKAVLCYNPDQFEAYIKWKVLRANYVIVPLILILLAAFNYFNILPQNFSYVVAVYGIAVGRISKYYYPKSAINGSNQPVIFRLFARRKQKLQKVKILKPVADDES